MSGGAADTAVSTDSAKAAVQMIWRRLDMAL
jgi:hypothetical protein